MKRIYEMAYTKREMMITGETPTPLKKIIFKVVNYLANKY